MDLFPRRCRRGVDGGAEDGAVVLGADDDRRVAARARGDVVRLGQRKRGVQVDPVVVRQRRAALLPHAAVVARVEGRHSAGHREDAGVLVGVDGRSQGGVALVGIPADRVPRGATVGGVVDLLESEHDVVGVGRVDGDVLVVPRLRAGMFAVAVVDLGVAVDEAGPRGDAGPRPRRSGRGPVHPVEAVGAAAAVEQHRVLHHRVVPRRAEGDPADVRLRRESRRSDLGVRHARVGRVPEAVVGVTTAPADGGEGEPAGVSRQDAHVGHEVAVGVGRAARRERAGPGAPVVVGAVQAVTGRREDVGLVEHDAEDRGERERRATHSRPRRAGVGRAVDAVAVVAVGVGVRLARTDPHRVRAAGVDGDRTDRLGAQLFGDRCPGRPAVDGLPHPAVGSARVGDLVGAGLRGDRRDAPRDGAEPVPLDAAAVGRRVGQVDRSRSQLGPRRLDGRRDARGLRVGGDGRCLAVRRGERTRRDALARHGPLAVVPLQGALDGGRLATLAGVRVRGPIDGGGGGGMLGRHGHPGDGRRHDDEDDGGDGDPACGHVGPPEVWAHGAVGPRSAQYQRRRRFSAGALAPGRGAGPGSGARPRAQPDRSPTNGRTRLAQRVRVVGVTAYGRRCALCAARCPRCGAATCATA